MGADPRKGEPEILAAGELQESGDAAPPQETLWQTAKGDFSQAAGLRLVGVIGMLAWMAFQWGWGNDILLPPIIARAFEAVDDGESWATGIGAVLAGTGAGSLFWGITQTLDGLIVIGGLSLIPGITDRISSFLRRNGWVKPFDELSVGTRFLIAYASGASALCLVDVFATGQRGLRSRRKMLAQAVGLAVAGVAVVVMVITAAVATGARVPATADAADFVVRYARNPLTWLAIYGSIVLISALAGRLQPDEDETN